jgi:N-acetylmuramoyl-L-alanine amidase
LSGWAFATKGYTPMVSVYVDDVNVAPTNANQRPDVCAVFPAALDCPNVGWSLQLDTTQFPDGPHTLKVVGYSLSYGTGFASVPITISNFASPDPMHLVIDSAGGALSGVANLRGWAVSDDAAIATVAVSVDGAVLGNASYGDSRNDVCEVYQNRFGCPNVGWHSPIDTTGLSNGAHTVSVTATSGFGEQSTQTATFAVKN